MRLRKREAPTSLVFEAFGVGVEIVVGAPELLPAVNELLPPDHTPHGRSSDTQSFSIAGSEADGYEVLMGAVSMVQHVTAEVALGMLDAQLKVFIAATAPEFIFVHAGVVADEGRALLIPGASFSGKTTLVRALVEAGATYYSDDYAALDGDGRVHPYMRRLRIRSEDGLSVDQRHVRELGGIGATESAEVAAVLITRYKPGADWQPREVSPAEGVIALLANTVPAQERPEESLRVLTRAVQDAVILAGDRGDARAVAPLLREQLASRDLA